jgi:hypothetical protein
MAVKMSEQTSARISAIWQATVMVAFVSELFENNNARKAIAIRDYRDFRHCDR